MIEEWNDELRVENHRLLALLTETEVKVERTEPKNLMPISGRVSRRSILRSLEAKQRIVAQNMRASAITEDQIVTEEKSN